MNDTGRGYKFIIENGGHKADQWMTFSLWHSLKNFASEAEVIISNPIGLENPLRWAYTMKVISKPRHSINYEEGNTIILPSHVMALRQFDLSNLGPCLAKSDLENTFVDYSKGCGRFVLSRWIDTNVIPFGQDAGKFWSDDMSNNEIKTINYWKSIDVIFKAVT